MQASAAKISWKTQYFIAFCGFIFTSIKYASSPSLYTDEL